MLRTVDILDAIKARLNLPSDYALAKQMGITHSAITIYRKKHTTMSDETALKAAKLLKIAPFYFMALANAERTKSPEVRREWEMLATEMEAREHKKIEALRLLAETSKAA